MGGAGETDFQVGEPRKAGFEVGLVTARVRLFKKSNLLV